MKCTGVRDRYGRVACHWNDLAIVIWRSRSHDCALVSCALVLRDIMLVYVLALETSLIVYMYICMSNAYKYICTCGSPAALASP